MKSDIISNRRALHHYHILERYEAGIELRGTEVKSVRAGLANLQQSFARIESGEVFLHGADIQPYERASHEQHEARRPRKLLLHRAEIDRLFGQSNIKGNTLVPLRLYWKNGRVKVELGVGQGKSSIDKRQDLKAKTEKREAERTMRAFNKSRS